MSKRKVVGVSSIDVGPSTTRSNKFPRFGGPSEDDRDPLISQLTAPSSTGPATRTLPSRDVPSLTTICARVFVKNLEFLFKERQSETQEWLKLIPEPVVPRLFAMLRAAHPSRLTHGFISAYFIRGDPMVLTGALNGVSSLTVQALSKLDPSLRELQLTGLDNINDSTVAQLLPGFPALEVLILRGSSKVGSQTVEAAAKACQRLKVVNLNYTSTHPLSIAALTASCLDLRVLKLAGVRQMSDLHCHQLLGSDKSTDGSRLAHLHTLNLRHTSITESAFSHIFYRCPALSRLDVSFTPIRHPAMIHSHQPNLTLTKLSLTSTPLTTPFLQSLGSLKVADSILSSLRTLHIGALGASPLTGVSTLPGSFTLTDDTLEILNDVLADCKSLENISLVGNTKLGLLSGVKSPLANFVRRVGRRCKILNLAGIPRLRSSDLAGLLPLQERGQDVDAVGDDIADQPSPLHTLVLNNTGVGDDSSQYIASCAGLTTLELAGTKFGYDSLFEILDSCTLLTKLDLTSCRGVKVGDRRQFFEVWKSQVAR